MVVTKTSRLPNAEEKKTAKKKSAEACAASAKADFLTPSLNPPRVVPGHGGGGPA